MYFNANTHKNMFSNLNNLDLTVFLDKKVELTQIIL